MKDIAAETGVSASTISRILNGYKRNFSVKPEIREKVMACVKARGYNPNPVFKSLRATKTKQLSLLLKPEHFSLPSMGHVVNVAMSHITPMLMAKGYAMNFHFNATGMDCPWEPPHWRVDGMLVPNATDASSLALLEESGIPFVCINGVAGRRGAAVMVDEAGNMGILMERLFELGHRRIAYASVRAQAHYSVEERHGAYLKHLGRLGLEPVPGHDEISELDPEDFLKKAVLKAKATALIVYDHVRVARYLQAAWRLGIEVPKRLSVATFNKDPGLLWSIPPVTCVDNSPGKIGEEAMRLLLESIEERRQTKGLEIRVEGSLIERESTGKAPERL